MEFGYKKTGKTQKIMKKLILILTIGMLLASCNAQRNLQGNDITHVIGINDAGDTIQVPIRELRREFRNDFQSNQYNNWQFYWGNNWYWGNIWYPYYFLPHQYQYSYRYHYWDSWYWRRNQVIINQPRQIQPPRPVQPPRRVVVPPSNTPRRVTPLEPRRYAPPRQTTPQQPRTTPTQPRTPSRGVNPSRGNSNGSPVIRQQPTRSSTPTRTGGVRKN